MTSFLLLQMLPEIRTDLFGKNPNRRFYNVSRDFIDDTCRQPD